jgi:SPP1 gp7 family putative phage head morphogenesis protein
MKTRHAWSFIRTAENDYARKLRVLGRYVGNYINLLFPNGYPSSHDAMSRLFEAMDLYSESLRPWAETAARSMIINVDRRNEAAWREHGKEMSRLLGREIAQTDIGDIVRDRLEAQVHLITSLPLEAAQRVHQLTIEAYRDASRAKEIAAEIYRSGEVTQNRAMLIARTETGRTSVEFTRARAEQIGSTHFIWHTVGDRDVRMMHKRLQGKTFRWDDPPIAEVNGDRHLPGAFPNCRCWAEPVVGDYV